MMRFLLSALILLPFAAFAAAPEPAPSVVGEVDPEVSALTDLQNRYTIGPWEGAGEGKTCTLTNNEPLAFGSLELSLVHDQIIARVTPTLPDVQPVVQEFLLDAPSKPFFAIGRYVYDTHGLERAFALFRACLENKLPANLPYEQLAESEPKAIAGEWQMITMKLGEYRYAAYAMLGDTGLGLWVHNTDRFVLSLTGVESGAGEKSVLLNGEAYDAFPQPGGFLIPLSPDRLRQLEAVPALSIKAGEYEKSFDIKDFRAVVAALQPYE